MARLLLGLGFVLILSLSQTGAFLSNHLINSRLLPYHSKYRVEKRNNRWPSTKRLDKIPPLLAIKIPSFGNLPFEVESLSYAEYLARKDEEKRKEELKYKFDYEKIDVNDAPLKEDGYFEHSQTIAKAYLDGEDEKAELMISKLDKPSQQHVYSLTIATILLDKKSFTRKELIMLKKFGIYLEKQGVNLCKAHVVALEFYLKHMEGTCKDNTYPLGSLFHCFKCTHTDKEYWLQPPGDVEMNLREQSLEEKMYEVSIEEQGGDEEKSFAGHAFETRYAYAHIHKFWKIPRMERESMRAGSALYMKRFHNLFMTTLQEENSVVYQARINKLPQKYNELVDLLRLSDDAKREALRRSMRLFLTEGLQAVCHQVRQEFSGSRSERLSLEECFEKSLPLTKKFLQLSRYGMKLMREAFFDQKLSKLSKKHFFGVAPTEGSKESFYKWFVEIYCRHVLTETSGQNGLTRGNHQLVDKDYPYLMRLIVGFHHNAHEPVVKSPKKKRKKAKKKVKKTVFDNVKVSPDIPKKPRVKKSVYDYEYKERNRKILRSVLKELLLENLPHYDVINAEQVSKVGYSLELSESAVTSAISQSLINLAIDLRHINYDDQTRNMVSEMLREEKFNRAQKLLSGGGGSSSGGNNGSVHVVDSALGLETDQLFEGLDKSERSKTMGEKEELGKDFEKRNATHDETTLQLSNSLSSKSNEKIEKWSEQQVNQMITEMGHHLGLKSDQIENIIEFVRKVSAASNMEYILEHYLSLNSKKYNHDLNEKLSLVKPLLDDLVFSSINATLILQTTSKILGNKISFYIEKILQEKKLMARSKMAEIRYAVELPHLFNYVVDRLYEIQKEFEERELNNASEENLNSIVPDDNISTNSTPIEKIMKPSQRNVFLIEKFENISTFSNKYENKAFFKDCDSILELDKKINYYKKYFKRLLKSPLTSLERSMPLIKALRVLETSQNPQTQEKEKKLALEMMEMIDFDPKTVFPPQLIADLIGRDISL